jgi:hypothetical protein
MLAAHAAAWRNRYELLDPQLIVFDHSPTAMLAARGMAVRRIVTGMGFTVPADTYPMESLRPWQEVGTDRLRQREDEALRVANAVLKGFGQPALERLGQLYSDVDDALLTTFPELDPYSGRRPRTMNYLGPTIATGGAEPRWPAGSGKRIFIYLRPFAGVVEVLRFLGRRALPTIAFVDGLASSVPEQCAAPTTRFESRRIDLSMAARDCDLAILNGTGGTTAAMLLAGRPSLQIPIHLEHALNAYAVERMGAGLSAPVSDPRAIVDRLDPVLGSEQYSVAARRFAEDHARFDSARQRDQIVERIEAVLNREWDDSQRQTKAMVNGPGGKLY